MIIIALAQNAFNDDIFQMTWMDFHWNSYVWGQFACLHYILFKTLEHVLGDNTLFL